LSLFEKKFPQGIAIVLLFADRPEALFAIVLRCFIMMEK